jgi:xylulokinase
VALLLGIDLGTSYFKVGLFDAEGALRGLGRVAVERDASAPCCCELSTARFWSILRKGLDEALSQAGAKAREIEGLSYSCQANSIVLLDQDQVPLTSLILWPDRRATPLLPELKAFSQRPDFATTVGFDSWSAEFAVAKIRWLQEHDPQRWLRARRVMTMADYFTFVLTDRPAIDTSTAAFLGLYDLRRRSWWSVALAASRIDETQLSSLIAPGRFAGRTGHHAGEFLGLRAGIPFAIGGLDHHVAGLGAGIGKISDLSISTGTVLAAMALVPAPTYQAGCYHGPHFDSTRFYRLAFDTAGASQLQDYQQCFGGGASIEDLLTLAAAAPPGCGAPNHSRNTDHGPSVRYLLEKAAATHRTLIERVRGVSNVSRVLATGGGSRSALWLQIDADMLGVPIMTIASPERACLGAAMLAGIAACWYRDLEQAMEAMLSLGPQFDPNPIQVARYRDWAP